PTRDAAAGSPTPSTEAAAPAATPARAGSEERDTQTTRASSFPSTTAKGPNLARRTRAERRGRVREPYGGNFSRADALVSQPPKKDRGSLVADAILNVG